MKESNDPLKHIILWINRRCAKCTFVRCCYNNNVIESFKDENHFWLHWSLVVVRRVFVSSLSLSLFLFVFPFLFSSFSHEKLKVFSPQTHKVLPSIRFLSAALSHANEKIVWAFHAIFALIFVVDRESISNASHLLNWKRKLSMQTNENCTKTTNLSIWYNIYSSQNWNMTNS